MPKVKTYTNLNSDELNKVVKKLSIDQEIAAKIISINTRIEFFESEEFLFLIFYIPEYNKETKTIESVEINVLFEIEGLKPTIFAYNTTYFFDKYKGRIDKIEFKGFGSFVEKFMSILLEDESRIIEHILDDTEIIKKEYFQKEDNHEIIRHLTSNQINISSLKLIITNQIKMIDLLAPFTTEHQKLTLQYKKNYIKEELDYAKDFSQTLMQSINTKFQVKSSEDLYIFTKYSFIVFVASFIIGLVTLVHMDNTPDTVYAKISILLTVACTLLILLVFRNNKK